MEHNSTGGTCTTGIGMVQSGLVHCAHMALLQAAGCLSGRYLSSPLPESQHFLHQGHCLVVVVGCPDNHISILSAALTVVHGQHTL